MKRFILFRFWDSDIDLLSDCIIGYSVRLGGIEQKIGRVDIYETYQALDTHTGDIWIYDTYEHIWKPCKNIESIIENATQVITS